MSLHNNTLEPIQSFLFESLFNDDVPEEIMYQRNQTMIQQLRAKINLLPPCRSSVSLMNIVMTHRYPLIYECEFHYNLDRLITLLTQLSAEYCMKYKVEKNVRTSVVDEIAWRAILRFMNIHQRCLEIMYGSLFFT
jgi:hypothetical protein